MVRLTPFRGDIRATQPDLPLLSWVRRLTKWSQNQARESVAKAKVYVDGQVALNPFEPIPLEARISIDTNRRAPHRQVSLSSRAVLYQDHCLIVVDKPGRMASVPPTTTGEPTLLDHLRIRLHDSGPLIVPVHRLDADTSGVMVFGLRGAALAALHHQVRRHLMDRRYLAVVEGRCPEGILRGELDVSRTPHSSGEHLRYAETRIRCLEEGQERTLVECRPRTGRYHQIRIQLAGAGHPIVGETRHLPQEHPGFGRVNLALHSCFLGLTHPETGEWMEWVSPMPKRFQELLRRAS